MPASRKQTFHFSPFTFDGETGELRRRSAVLRIPEQAARLLPVLLERAGTIVTREDLKRVLWPDGEHVDYDQGINKAINRLRDILSDDPKDPIYIETVSKRGYRFLAKVEIHTTETVAEQATAPTELETLPPATPVIHEEEHPASRNRGGFLARRSIWAFALVLLLGLIALGALTWRNQQKASRSHQTIYIGIAPLDARGEEMQAITDGLRLEIADSLAQLPGVQIRAAHSLDTLKHQDAAIREASRNLNIQILLFGTLANRGNRILLQLEIVRGADSVHIASLEYDVSRQQLTSLGDRIQRDVFTAIQSSQTYGGLPHGGTQDPVAYAAYLEARSLADLRTPAAVNAAIAQYKTATSRDPLFAKAYAGMATAYEVLAQHHFAPLDASTQQAKELSQKALKIDPACAEAHALLGFILFAHDWNALAGEKELRTGIGLDPSHAPYHMWLAILLSDEGRTQESLQEMDLAKATDPLWPPIYGTETFVAQNARDTKRVFEAAFTYLKLQPQNPLALDQLGWSWWNCGKYREAIDEWRRMAAMEHDDRRMAVEDRGLKEFQRQGVQGYARVRLEDIHAKPAPTQLPNDYNEAEWYAIAGDRENALAALEQLVNNHDSYALEISTVLSFKDLHGDPRFETLVKRVGMPMQIAPPSHNPSPQRAQL